jgi:hypothetical protein
MKLDMGSMSVFSYISAKWFSYYFRPWLRQTYPSKRYAGIMQADDWFLCIFVKSILLFD